MSEYTAVQYLLNVADWMLYFGLTCAVFGLVWTSFMYLSGQHKNTDISPLFVDIMFKYMNIVYGVIAMIIIPTIIKAVFYAIMIFN